MKKIDLFVIDGQNSFCASGKEPKDWPAPAGGHRAGELYVEGADLEAVRVADMIKRLRDPNHQNGHKLNNLRVSLDSHHRNDGSHNTSWKGPDGKSPPPFTIVSNEDVRNQKWLPRFPFGVWQGKICSSYDWALKYTEALESNGRCPLCLWPVHCEIGTWGQCIYYPLLLAYNDWCEVTGRWIEPITKGDWVWTEHYSALKADVPDPTVPKTGMNTEVVQSAMEADLIVWCGWAGSHCLRWTALDAINNFGAGSNEFIRKCVFLEDASAPVPNPPGGPNFKQWRLDFLDEVAKRGGTITTTTEFLK